MWCMVKYLNAVSQHGMFLSANLWVEYLLDFTLHQVAYNRIKVCSFESFRLVWESHWNPCWIQFRILPSLLASPLLGEDLSGKVDKRRKRHKGESCCVASCIIVSYSESNPKQSSGIRRSSLPPEFWKEIFNLLQSTDCMISCNRVRLICILRSTFGCNK